MFRMLTRTALWIHGFGRKPAGLNPARVPSKRFFFGRSKRQGAKANAVDRANPPLITACMVQFLKRGDWLYRQVRGLLTSSMSIPRGAGTPSLPNGVGGGFWLEKIKTLEG